MQGAPSSSGGAAATPQARLAAAAAAAAAAADKETEADAGMPDGGLLGHGFGGDQAEVAHTKEEGALEAAGMDADDFDVSLDLALFFDEAWFVQIGVLDCGHLVETRQRSHTHKGGSVGSSRHGCGWL